MPKYTITPSFSPDVLCEFEIPRETGKPIEFAVHRMDYIKNFDLDTLAWSVERMKPVPVLDDAGESVLNGDGEPTFRDADPIGDNEAILAYLRIAGVPATKIKQIEKLTNGEIAEIYATWTKMSRVSVGESGASVNS